MSPPGNERRTGRAPAAAACGSGRRARIAQTARPTRRTLPFVTASTGSGRRPLTIARRHRSPSRRSHDPSIALAAAAVAAGIACSAPAAAGNVAWNVTVGGPGSRSPPASRASAWASSHRPGRRRARAAGVPAFRPARRHWGPRFAPPPVVVPLAPVWGPAFVAPAFAPVATPVFLPVGGFVATGPSGVRSSWRPGGRPPPGRHRADPAAPRARSLAVTPPGRCPGARPAGSGRRPREPGAGRPLAVRCVRALPAGGASW